MGSLFGLCVLTVLLGFVKTELQNKEFALGGTLTLKPAAFTFPITSITWKHNDNLLAERLSKESETEYYPPTEKRISLNFETGELSIIKVTEKDAGKYNVEINNVIQNVGYQVNIIKQVPVPTVVVQPLACSDTNPNCVLDCHGDVTGAGTVRYFWKEDNGDWKESAKKRDIKNDADMQTIKEFFCKVQNSVSEEKSPATKNPFYKEPGSSAGMVGGIVGGFILLLLITSGLAVAYKKGFFPKRAQNTKNTKGTPPGTVEEPLVVKSESNSQPPGSDAGSAPEPITKSDPAPTPRPEPSSKV